MAKKKGDYPIPFDDDGNLVAWVGRNDTDAKWKENFVFDDTLRYAGFTRGQSSAKLIFKSVNHGKRYEMFLADFDDMMKRCGFNANPAGVQDMVTAKWTFGKRGENYGIRLADEG